MKELIFKIRAGLPALYFLNFRKNPNHLIPSMMSIKLTERCNYRCITCGEYDIGNKKNELGLRDWERVIKDFKKLGGMSVRFTGGEPFLRRDDLFSLISLTKSAGMRAAIATNGFLVREEDMGFMKRNGIDHITISLHGCKETHDNIVGIRGSWERIDRSIDQMKGVGLPVDIAFTIIKKNMDEIPFMVNYARNKKIGVGFNIFDNQLYFFKKTDADIEPPLSEMDRISLLLQTLRKKYPGSVNGHFNAFAEIPNLVRDARLRHYYCSRTLMELAFDSFGNLYHGCWVMPAAGNITQQDLQSILGSEKYRQGRLKGFQKECPGCTCGYELDVLMNLKKRRTIPEKRSDLR